MSVLLLAFNVVVLAAIALYKYATEFHDYFKKRGIKFIEPTFFLGTTGQFILKRMASNDFHKKVYNAFPKEKLIGIFDFRKPLVLLRDPEIIKQICVKDFDYFMDHQGFLTESSDDMFSNSLIALRGDKWRDMRTTLSPAFTGSKMRQMFILVQQCATDMSVYFKKQAASGEELNYEMKDVFSKYSNDVIATAAFGIEVNSFSNPKNEFFRMGKETLNFNFLTSIKLVIMRTAPWIMRALKMQVFDQKYARFFKSMVLEAIDHRIKNEIFRPDMINILKDIVKLGGVQSKSDEAAVETADGFSAVDESDIAKKHVVKRKWKDIELVAQCFLFFVAGFNTASTMLSFAAYELVTNKDIEEKLYAEILEMEQSLGGKPLGYDDLQKMKYMDMFTTEILRLWPVAMSADRSCAKNYELKMDDKSFTIEKGTTVWIPIYGLHHDSKYFKNPEQCDPERFSDENKNNVVPGTYLPFGIGPRNCIGSRFALMEVKAVLYYLMLNFKFEPNAETQIPIKLEKGFQLRAEKGVKLRLAPRH